MTDYVKKYVSGCAACIRAKKRNQRRHGSLKPLPVLEGPWQWTESDHIVKLPESKGYDSIYVVVDRFTKMGHFIPCREEATEEDIVDLHLKYVWKHHGLPLIHSTDRHGKFTGNYVRKLFKGLGIEQRFSTAYHPQTQGQVENLNGWLETYLRIFCNQRKENWADLLHLAEYAWNNHHHTSLGTTPFYANYGFHPTMTDRASIGQDLPKRIERLVEHREHIRQHLARSQEIQKAAYDRWRGKTPSLKEGDMVFLSTENLVTHEGMKKLTDLRTGPFKIIKRVSDSAYKLELPPRWRVHPVFNIELLTPAEPDPIPGRVLDKPPPEEIGGEFHHVIDRLVNACWTNGKTPWFQYRVHYKGEDKSMDEWQFRDDLLEDLGAESLMDFEEEFYKGNPGAPRYTDAPRPSKPRRGYKKSS